MTVALLLDTRDSSDGHRPPLQESVGFRQGDATEDSQHQHTADQSEGRHEIKITAPAFIEQRAEKNIPRDCRRSIGTNRSRRRRSRPFRAANIHRRRCAENRMGRSWR